MSDEIPIGYCQCGCGQRTNINPESRKERGIEAGQPSRYIKGHNTRKYRPTDPSPPVRLCACGCGKPTPLARATSHKHGRIQGQPQEFCIGHRKAVITTPQCFWPRVDRRGPDECWDWLGYVNDSGYGVTRTSRNKAVRATHIAYRLSFGPIPEGMFVCHKCDNPRCCNPDHLFLGSPADNVHDMDNKGRRVTAPHPGESHGMSKLTDDQVQEIRHLAENGVSYAEIGRRFNISDVHAGRIARRLGWQHLP